MGFFNGYLDLGTYNDIEIMPLKRFSLEMNQDSEKEGILIFMLEQGSQIAFSPVTVQNDEGGEEMQGMNIEITLIIPFNKWYDKKLEEHFKYYAENPTHYNDIYLHAGREGTRERYFKNLKWNDALNSKPDDVSRWWKIASPFSIVYNPENADMRQRFRVTMKKFLTHEKLFSDLHLA